MIKRSFINLFAIPMAILATMLTGCASTELAPLPLKLPSLAPPTTAIAMQRVQPQPARMMVVDQRPQHHALRLHHGANPAQFATLQEPIATIVRQQLAPYFSYRGDHPLLLQVTIEQALCVANESFSSHNMNCTVVVQANASVPASSWSKSFTTTRSREGKFKLKNDYIQIDIAAVLNGALSELINDAEFYTWLNTYVPNAAHVIEETTDAF